MVLRIDYCKHGTSTPISIRPILHVQHDFPLSLFTSHYNKLVHTFVCATQTFLCLSS